MFVIKFLFSEEHTFCKQKRTVVYGRASLVSGFQLIRENDDLLSPRHKFLRCHNLCKKISKKEVYVDYGATADIPQDAVKQYGDLAASK